VKKLKLKIAIVGGAGVVGRSLARHLSKKFQVKILDVKPIPEDLKGLVTHVDCDVRNYQEMANGTKRRKSGCTYCHCANTVNKRKQIPRL
jgi:nucleoside-diphosphate-sugar epimerase